MDATTDGNGKVTLAVISAQLREIERRLERIETCQEKQNADHERRISNLETGQATRNQQILVLTEDVKSLERKSDTWSILNSMGAIIAAVIAGLGLGTK